MSSDADISFPAHGAAEVEENSSNPAQNRAFLDIGHRQGGESFPAPGGWDETF